MHAFHPTYERTLPARRPHDFTPPSVRYSLRWRRPVPELVVDWFGLQGPQPGSGMSRRFADRMRTAFLDGTRLRLSRSWCAHATRPDDPRRSWSGTGHPAWHTPPGHVTPRGHSGGIRQSQELMVSVTGARRSAVPTTVTKRSTRRTLIGLAWADTGH